MSKSIYESDVEYVGKAFGRSFKQQQRLDQLIKDGKVLPASELVKRRQDEAKRASEFTRAVLDEESHRRTKHSVGPNCPTPIGQKMGVFTREPFEG
jgi:hypothetical protein